MSLFRNHLFIPILSLLAIACTDSDTIIHESSEKSESYRVPETCQEYNACTQIAGVTIWIEEKQIKEETPFNIYLATPVGSEVEIESAKIEGITMNMGYIPLFFKQQKNAVYQAEGMIGACDTEDMKWQVHVTLSAHSPEKTLVLEIPNTAK